MATYKGGPAEVAFRDKLIPADMISNISFSLESGERTAETLAGTFTQDSGTYTVQVVMTVFVPSMDWLGANILTSKYNSGSAPQVTGNVIFGSDNCASDEDEGPLNIHYKCEETDDNDIHLYNAKVRANLSMEYSQSDPLQVELTFNGHTNNVGNILRLGTGDLTAASEWDYATEATVAVV